MNAAEIEIDGFEECAIAHAKAVVAEQAHEARRADAKMTAVCDLVTVENPATPGKLYSFTAAECFAARHPFYAAHLERARELTEARLVAEARMQAQRFTAQLAVARETVAA